MTSASVTIRSTVTSWGSAGTAATIWRAKAAPILAACGASGRKRS